MTSICDRIDAHTHVSEEKLILKPPFPDSIKIEITSRCNYNCSFCAVQQSKRPKGDIDKKFLYRILHEAKEMGVKEIGMFLLGESLLVPELPEYIRYAKEEAGIDYVFLTTNGLLCDVNLSRKLARAGLDSLKFSINAGIHERYEKIHGSNSFARVMGNLLMTSQMIKIARTAAFSIPLLSVSCIWMPEHADELNAFKAEIEPLVDDFYFLPLYNQAGHVGGKDYTKIVGNPGRLENMANPVPCWALFNAAKITWDGKLTACCFDHDERFEIADLNKVSLLEAWHHPKFIELRQQHLDNNVADSLCAKCLGY